MKEKYPQLSHTFANCLQHRAPTLVALIYWSFVGCIQELKNLFYRLFVRTSWEIEWFHKHFVNNCFLGVCWHWDVNLEWSKYCESWILKVQLLHHCKRCTLTAYIPFCLQFCFIWPAQCFQVLKFEHSCLKWPCTCGHLLYTLCLSNPFQGCGSLEVLFLHLFLILVLD